MLKKNIFIVLLLLFWVRTQAQEDNSVFQFLKLPFSSHAAALGGENISIIEDDLTMAVHNPALLSCVADKTLNLNYTLYIAGVNAASAAFSRVLGDRSTWAVTAQFVNYGTMKETTSENIITGTFSAKDMAFSGIYSYDLSDYYKFSSFAIGVDLGLNYYHQNSDFSFSMVARNLGGQIVAFEDKREKLPVDVQVGITKRLSHAPFRISATLYNLTDWKNSKFFDHAVIGMDFLPTDNFYVSLGYNFRRTNEMKVADSSHWAGFTAGAGLQIKRFKLGAAYAKYHLSTSSLLFNLSMTL